MTVVTGKNGISAEVLCDSITEKGNRLTTFVIEYPRIILSELNTHRMLPKNSASSRAIPFAKMSEQLTGKPVRFGAANKGMQDKGEEHTTLINGMYTAEEWWNLAKLSALKFAEGFYEAGYHKQIFNRRTEADQMMRTVISGTEWNNFLWLRCDSAADPTIYELARCIREARDNNVPEVLKAGEWHLPYVTTTRNSKGLQEFWESNYDGVILSTEDAIKVSCARACAVSFRNTDYDLEKSKQVYARLVGDEKIHGSALEHAAMVIEPFTYEFGGPNACTRKHVNNPEKPHTWQEGISHMDREGNLWSGPYKGFIQHRKTIKNENHN